MAQILQPGSSYPPADFYDFNGFASTGEGYKRPRSYAVSLAGAEITHESRLIKARGYKAIATWDDKRIREIMQYRNDSQDVILLFGSSADGTTAAIGSMPNLLSGSPSITSILAGIDPIAQACLLQFGNNAYLFNGADDQWWDGITWRPIGTAAPVSAATFNMTIAGAMNTSSEYYVAWRWYDSVNGRRSNLSPVSDIMTTGATGADAGLRVTLPGEAIPSGYDKIQVLVTLAFNNQFFVDQVVDAAVTSVDIVLSDVVRSVNEIDEGILDDAPYRKYDIVVKANNKIYGARTDDSGCRVERTRVSSQVGALPQSWSPRFFSDCEPSASDLIVGMGVCGSQESQTVIVIKQKCFGKLVQIAPDLEIFQKLGDIGGHGHKSVFSMGVLCGWVNESNAYLTDGLSYQEIGGAEDGLAIADTFRGLSQSYKQKVCAVHVPISKQIRISAVTAGQADNNIVLMGHYNKLESLGIVKWTTREQGFNKTDNPGVQAACMKVVLDDTDQFQTLFGNSNGNGKLYLWDFGTTDDTKGIYAKWVFRPETFGDLKNEKLFSDIHIRMRTGNSTAQVTLGVQQDLTGALTVLDTLTLGGAGFIMGSSQLGVTPFSDSPVFSEIVPCQIRAQELAFVVQSFDTKTMELLDFTMTGLL